MKYKNSINLYCRKLGQPRKDNSIYATLGHPYDIKNKNIIYVGPEKNPYSLTLNKKYLIINTATVKKYNWDNNIYTRMKKQNIKGEQLQSEDYYVVLINDKGHKRRYFHKMFKMCEE